MATSVVGVDALLDAGVGTREFIELNFSITCSSAMTRFLDSASELLREFSNRRYVFLQRSFEYLYSFPLFASFAKW